MKQFNAFFLANLLIVVSFLPVSMFLILRGKSKVSILAALWLLAVTMWGLAAILINFSGDPLTALILWKFAYCFVLFIPIFYCHCVLELVHKNNHYLIFALYVQAITFSHLTFTNKLFNKTRLVFDSIYWPNGNTYHLISFIIWLLIIVCASIQLLHHLKESHQEDKDAIAILAVALVGFSGGMMNFFPTYGFDIYPVGNFFIPIAGIVLTYAILKYQLFDIQIALKRGIVYYLLIWTISLFYLIMVIVSEKVLRGLMKYQSTSISVIAAFLIGVLFFPLRDKIRKIVNKNFFVKSHEEIEQENMLLKVQVTQVEKIKNVALLASGMAHEIKNPLTPIKTFFEYLPQKSHDKEFIEKFGNLARTSVNRIDELINELLKFAKPSPLHLISSDICKLINSTLDLLNNEFLKYNVRINKNITDTTWLSIDENQVRQALLNIFLNAIDAMPKGGTLTVGTTITSKNENKTYLISIQDTGAGIAKEDLPHIFDPFFTRKDKGTGLGLSITNGIIAEHGGKIRVESESGIGTKFIIELPVA